MTSAWFPETRRDRRNAVNGFSILIKNLMPEDLVYLNKDDGTVWSIRLITDTRRMNLRWRELTDGTAYAIPFSTLMEWHVKTIVRNGISCETYPELVRAGRT